MSLKDRLDVRPQPATIEAWIATLDKNDAAALYKAAVDPNWSNPALAAVVKEEGFQISRDGIGAWRRRVGLSR